MSMPSPRRERPMAPDLPTVLLTGFGPFPTVAANATSLLVPRIAAAARERIPGVRFAMHILPTEWTASLDLLEALYLELHPSIALHFGVSGRARGFEIEVRGRNVCCQSEDAAGYMPVGQCITPDGPELLPASLPASHIVARLRRRHLPARISRDAGGYLCNALLYRALELSRERRSPARSGFIHLPSTLVSDRRPALEPKHGRRLGWEQVVEGGLEIILASLGRPSLANPPRPRARLPKPA